jgi:hypothetical protein
LRPHPAKNRLSIRQDKAISYGQAQWNRLSVNKTGTFVHHKQSTQIVRSLLTIRAKQSPKDEEAGIAGPKLVVLQRKSL